MEIGKDRTRRFIGRCYQRAFRMAVPLFARIVWYAGPAATAQARAGAVARWAETIASRLLGGFENSFFSVRAVLMNDMLCEFARLKPGFPLNVEMTGEVMPPGPGEGALLATIHTRLGLAANAAFRQAGQGPVFVGIPQENLQANSWGSAELAETIDASGPAVFAKLRRALEQGRTVVVFVDFGLSPDGRIRISPNLFHWAEIANVPITYMLSSLGDDGEIRLQLAPEPQGATGGEARSRAFTAFLATRSAQRFDIRRPKDTPRRWSHSSPRQTRN